MSNMRVLYIFLLALELCYATECGNNEFFESAGPTVKTRLGLVLGKYVKYFDTDVAVFFGIPYAKAPIGERRFTAPEPIESWDGYLFAQEEEAPCVQYIPPSMNYSPHKNFSEDCLYLNVWAPKVRCIDNSKKLPVLVWIHGGGLSRGSADTNRYDGSKIVTHGEVVLVSMNYRVGPLGFLNIGNREAPGNMGLMDQVFAMRWVKENIEFFGGDPGSITIFGVSAGSWSVNLHLISPLSRDLFHRAIMQSGSMYSSFLTDSPEKTSHRANALAIAVGCVNDTVNLDTDASVVMKCMRTKDPVHISKLDRKLRSNTYTYVTAGNEFLPKRPISAFETGEVAPVEIIIGVMKNEGTLFLPRWAPEYFTVQSEPKPRLEDMRKAISSLFTQLSSDVHDEIYNFYFKNITQDDHATIIDAVQYALGDYTFNCPIMFLGEKLDNAYMYWMTHESFTNSKLPAWFGAHHAADLFYVFGKTWIKGASLSPRDYKFSNDVIKYWTNFAHYGHPISGDSKPKWSKFSLSEDTTYELNEGNYKTIPYPRREQCEFWRPIIAQHGLPST